MLALGRRAPWMQWWLFGLVASAAGAVDDAASWGIREGFTVLPEPGVALSFALGTALLARLRRAGDSRR